MRRMRGGKSFFFYETSKRNVDVQIKSYLFNVMEDYTSYTMLLTDRKGKLIANELVQHTLWYIILTI